jgi:alpha-tubulin suppressor-like RCC1 family protein
VHRDGHVSAWGANDLGQASVPAGLSDITAVAAGVRHSLALRRDGHVTAWGDNDRGQASVPVGLAKVIALDGGTVHSIALVAH